MFYRQSHFNCLTLLYFNQRIQGSAISKISGVSTHKGTKGPNDFLKLFNFGNTGRSGVLVATSYKKYISLTQHCVRHCINIKNFIFCLHIVIIREAQCLSE